MRHCLPLAIALAAALAVTGCSSGPRVDAASADTLSASLARYVLSGPASSRPARQKVAQSLRTVYFDGAALRAKLPNAVPPASNLHRVRFDELAPLAARIVQWNQSGQAAASRQLPEESPTERRWRNQFLIDQLNVQRSILEAERDLGRYRELFTVDQLEFADASFIPPQEGVPLGQDKAVFVATFTNRAMFNVYGAGFHIVVTDPRMRYPVVDQVLKYDAGKLPIQVGESREIHLTCCDSFSDPTRNLQLRTLPADADIRMDLVSIFDFSKKDRLRDATFSADENVRLVASEKCVEDITANLSTWTPETAAPACSKY